MTVSAAVLRRPFRTASGYLSGGGLQQRPRRPSGRERRKQYMRPAYHAVFPELLDQRRGFPDVSAVGHNAWCIYAGSPALISGTSESTPIFAAIVSLLLGRFQGDYG